MVGTPKHPKGHQKEGWLNYQNLPNICKKWEGCYLGKAYWFCWIFSWLIWLFVLIFQNQCRQYEVQFHHFRQDICRNLVCSISFVGHLNSCQPHVQSFCPFISSSQSPCNKVLCWALFLCGSCHISSFLIGVEYWNCRQPLDVYLLFAIWIGQIQSKLIYICVSYELASL